MGAATACSALELPELSLRYETALGAEEEERDEGLLRDYTRHTWLAKGRQELGERARFDLEARYSTRQNVRGEGDTDSWRLTPRLDFDIGRELDLAGEVSTERVIYPEDQTRNYAAYGVRFEGAYDFGAVAVDGWFRPVLELHDVELARDRQVYTTSPDPRLSSP